MWASYQVCKRQYVLYYGFLVEQTKILFTYFSRTFYTHKIHALRLNIPQKKKKIKKESSSYPGPLQESPDTNFFYNIKELRLR